MPRFNLPRTLSAVNRPQPAAKGLRGCPHREEIRRGVWVYCSLDRGHNGPHEVRVNQD